MMSNLESCEHLAPDRINVNLIISLLFTSRDGKPSLVECEVTQIYDHVAVLRLNVIQMLLPLFNLNSVRQK